MEVASAHQAVLSRKRKLPMLSMESLTMVNWLSEYEQINIWDFYRG